MNVDSTPNSGSRYPILCRPEERRPTLRPMAGNRKELGRETRKEDRDLSKARRGLREDVMPFHANRMDRISNIDSMSMFPLSWYTSNVLFVLPRPIRQT